MITTVYLVTSLTAVRPETMVDGTIFVLPDGNTFQFRQSKNGDDGELGGILSTILGIAGAAANVIPGVGQFVSLGIGAVGSLLNANSVPGQARGLAGINNFGTQVIAKFDELIAAAAGCKIPPAEAYKAADELVAILSNPQAVYQAQRGNDAAALANFKTQAAAKAQQVKAAVDQCVTATPPPPGTQIINGQIVAGPPPPGGIDTTTLLLFGGVGLLAVFLLMK